MKICVLTHSLFSYGGVQRVTSTLCNQLAENNEITIVYLGDLEYSKEKLYGLNENKIKIERKKLKINIIEKCIRKFLNLINNNSNILNNNVGSILLENAIYPKSQKEDLISFFNNKNYDIIIASEGEISLLLASIADKLNSKTIGWQHNSYDAYYYKKNKYSWKKEYLSIKIFKRLDALVVLTEDDNKIYRNKMNIQCCTIYNPLSFRSLEKSDCMSKNIISVGRLVEQKGFDLLLRAFKIVCNEIIDYNLIIVGEGPEKENLINLVDELKLNNKVQICNFTNNIKNYYLNSSIFVSSSRWEGFGLVVTEAMECGVPVVAFDNAGPKEIINNNINGILIPRENIEALAEAIVELIKNRNKRFEISKNAIKRSQDFNIQNIAKQWEKLFLELS